MQNSQGNLFIGLLDNNNTTEANVQQAIPVAGTISQFYVRTTGDVGDTGDNYTFTIRINGAAGATPVTCTIIGNNTGTQQSCSDLTNSVAVTAGQLFSILSTEASSPNGVSVHWTAKFVAN